MNHETFSPVGARVTDVALSEVTAAAATGLRRLIATHGVVVFSQQQDLDEIAFASLLRTIGRAGTAVGPEVAGLQSPAAAGRSEEVARLPADRYTGSTVFSNQYRAFETLPLDVRDWLLGRSVRHSGGRQSTDQQAVAEHPLFRRHPLTGRVVLHLPERSRGWRVSGLPDDVGAETIGYLVDHSMQPGNVLRHLWSAGDVLVWDSWGVRSNADLAYTPGPHKTADQLASRTSVQAGKPGP